MCDPVAVNVLREDVTALQREILYYRDIFIMHTIVTEQCTIYFLCKHVAITMNTYLIQAVLVRISTGQFYKVLVALYHCRPVWAEPCHYK